MESTLSKVQEGLNITLDPEKSLEVQNSCINLFTRFLNEQEEDVAFQNISAIAILIYDSFQLETSVACKKGCSYCCHQPVYINLAEVRTIALHLSTLPETIRQDSLKRLKRLANLSVQKYGKTQINKKYSCPFLDTEEGACRIYDVRPLACRRYTSNSLSDCISLYEGNEVEKFTIIPLYRIVAEVLNHSVYLTLKEYYKSHENIEEYYDMNKTVYYTVKNRKIK